MMKRLFLLVFTMLLSVSFVSGAWWTGANWDVAFTKPYPAKANDFHIKGKVKSANNTMPILNNKWSYDHVGPSAGGTTWHQSGYSISQDSTDPNFWNFQMDFKTNGIVFNGATVHFGMEFQTEIYNKLVIEEAYWTYNGVKVEDVPLTGFHVWDVPAGTIVRFRNDTTEPVVLEQVELAVTDEAVPLQDMFYTGLGYPGMVGDAGAYGDVVWHPFPEPIVLDPGHTYDINLAEVGLSIAPHQFLQFRANNVLTGTANWWQHEH